MSALRQDGWIWLQLAWAASGFTAFGVAGTVAPCWRSLNPDRVDAAVRSVPYQDSYRASTITLIIVHRDGPVRVRRDLCGERTVRVVQPGDIHLPAQHRLRSPNSVDVCQHPRVRESLARVLGTTANTRPHV